MKTGLKVNWSMAIEDLRWSEGNSQYKETEEKEIESLSLFSGRRQRDEAQKVSDLILIQICSLRRFDARDSLRIETFKTFFYDEFKSREHNETCKLQQSLGGKLHFARAETHLRPFLIEYLRKIESTFSFHSNTLKGFPSITKGLFVGWLGEWNICGFKNIYWIRLPVLLLKIFSR